MLIRQACEADAQTIAEAEYATALAQEGLLAAQPHEIPVSAYVNKIRALSDRGLYVVLEVGGKIVGHLILEPLGLRSIEHVVQLTIVIHPGHTDRGFGRVLMQHGIEWARGSEQIEKIELRVRSTNLRAIHLYESLGFEREGVMKRRIKLSNRYADDICMALFV